MTFLHKANVRLSNAVAQRRTKDNCFGQSDKPKSKLTFCLPHFFLDLLTDSVIDNSEDLLLPWSWIYLTISFTCHWSEDAGNSHENVLKWKSHVLVIYKASSLNVFIFEATEEIWSETEKRWSKFTSCKTLVLRSKIWINWSSFFKRYMLLYVLSFSFFLWTYLRNYHSFITKWLSLYVNSLLTEVNCQVLLWFFSYSFIICLL